MFKVLITTVPFAEKNKLPLELLENAGIEYTINPIGRKLKEDELTDLIPEFDLLIAGTEPITKKVIASAKNLKLISRVGIGLDSVDLLAAKDQNIAVSYTPDAPAPAVAELTLGMIFSLLRHLHIANTVMHRREWERFFGRRITEVTIGVIGAGRIGGRVLRRLDKLGSPRILVNDIHPNQNIVDNKVKLEWVDKETILREADVVTLHLPLTAATANLITYEKLKMMKPDGVIINTSRGGIINEHDLYRVMSEGHLSAAGIDVFEDEPYKGELINIERCMLTSHMGSMSIDCRAKMEIEATEEVVRFVNKEALRCPVPRAEYDVQAQKADIIKTNN